MHAREIMAMRTFPGDIQHIENTIKWPKKNKNKLSYPGVSKTSWYLIPGQIKSSNFRDQKDCKGVPLFACKNCDAEGENNDYAVIINSDYMAVCTGCGTVLEDCPSHISVSSIPSRGLDCQQPYKCITYFNEYFSQFLATCPGIPFDIFVEIKKASVRYSSISKKRYDQFERTDIGEILRSIKVPQQLSTKYKSSPRPQNRFKNTPLLSLTKYAERWVLIKKKLLNDTIEIFERPHTETLLKVRRYFLAVEHAFRALKEQKRKHLHSYRYVIARCFKKADKELGKNEFEKCRKFWILPSEKKIARLDAFWKEVCLYHSWEYDGDSELYIEYTTIYLNAQRKKLVKQIYLQ